MAGLGLYWAASAIVRCIQQLAINKYLSTKSLDEMIAENQKKAQKKREKHGAPAKEINKMATTSTRNAGKVTKGQSGISESERDSKIQEAQARAQIRELEKEIKQLKKGSSLWLKLGKKITTLSDDLLKED